MSRDYLLEIGVEEIPARYISNALKQIEKNAINLFKEERTIYENIEVYATPRRLSMIVNGIKDNKTVEKLKIKGPAKRISFDDQGNPSKALLGFMKSQNINLSSITVEEFKGEEYVYAQVTKESKSLEEIIKLNMADFIKSINFPKTMKWGGKNIRFARPIRWIVSLLDDKVIEFELEGIPVSNKTKGHRFLGSDNITINNVSNYIEILKENYVILDQNERREIIEFGSEKLVKEKGAHILKDKSLLEEVTYLVEYPTPLIGKIKEEYLDLPADVIITPMKEHLRYFPVVDDNNRLKPYFITIKNGDEQHLDIVTKGNEKVLGARLEDAKFFFEEDTKEPLENFVENLKTIIFQEKLGTLYDKTLRIQKLSEKVADYLEVGDQTQENLNRASYLSKADLASKMVIEFTELQGKMGMEYASASGENEIVSLAIHEQYLPKYSGDDLPTTTAGSILSITDKLDTIAGLFAIDIKPTGSQDPFALRRSALGIINIIIDKKLNLPLNEVIDYALYIYVEENGLAFDYNKTKKEVLAFFKGRLRNMFLDSEIRYDIIEAVLNSKTDDIYDIKIRIDKLDEWLKDKDADGILNSFNRISTLAEKTESNEVKRDLLEKDEIQLYDEYNSIEEKFITSINKKEYNKALDVLASLTDSIDDYFENVMVMVEDEEIKQNRLALLRKIYDSMLMVCDLSKIVN